MHTSAITYRWAELLSLDEAVTLMALDRLPTYGFTGVTLWSSFMNRGLDQYYFTIPVTYKRFPEFNALRDRTRVQEGAAFLTEFISRAHAKGLTVQHNYDLCGFIGGLYATPVDAIKQVHPEWLNAYDEPDYSQDAWFAYMAAEVEDFLEEFPGLDGLFCWNCENSAFTPTELRHQTIPHSEIVLRATKVVYDVCQRYGKLMTHDIHSGGGHREHTEHIIAAAAECPELILGADCTYSDWQMFLPTTPWLAKMRAKNHIYVGFDAAGEYFGKGKVLGPWPGWITRHFNNAQVYTPTAITVRTEAFSRDTSAFVLPLLDINVRTLLRLAVDGKIDLEAELERWWHDHFEGPWSPTLCTLILRMEELQRHVLHVNSATCMNKHLVFPRSILVDNCQVALFEQFAEPGSSFDPRDENWIINAGGTVKPFAALRQEKLDGMALCDDAVSQLQTLVLPTETYRVLAARFMQAKDVACAFLHLLDAAHALHQIIGDYRDHTLADPRMTLREAQQLLRRHADAMDMRWGTTFFEGFTSSVRQCADSIPAQYLRTTME